MTYLEAMKPRLCFLQALNYEGSSLVVLSPRLLEEFMDLRVDL
jgi:hypothetical protein